MKSNIKRDAAILEAAANKRISQVCGFVADHPPVDSFDQAGLVMGLLAASVAVHMAGWGVEEMSPEQVKAVVEDLRLRLIVHSDALNAGRRHGGARG